MTDKRMYAVIIKSCYECPFCPKGCEVPDRKERASKKVAGGLPPDCPLQKAELGDHTLEYINGRG